MFSVVLGGFAGGCGWFGLGGLICLLFGGVFWFGWVGLLCCWIWIGVCECLMLSGWVCVVGVLFMFCFGFGVCWLVLVVLYTCC